MHLARKIVAGIVIFMVVAAVAVMLSADSLLNGIVRERIIRDANSREGASLSLGTIHYSVFTNRLSCDSLHYMFKRNHHVQFDLAADTFSCSDVNWLRLLAGGGVSCRELTLTGARGQISVPEALDTLQRVNVEKEEDSGDDSKPFMPFVVGRLSLHGGEFFLRAHSPAGTAHDSLSRFALEVNDLHLESLSRQHLESSLADAEVECRVEGADFQIPGSVYRIGFASARVSKAESMVQVDSLKIGPGISDKAFFAGDRYGSTRFKSTLGRLVVRGLDVPGLIEGKRYVTQQVSINRPVVNITVDKRNNGKKTVPTRRDSARMPNEILSGMKPDLRVDSLYVSAGIIEYAELYPWSTTPAVLRWTGVRLATSAISNSETAGNSSPVHIDARGLFQDTAQMLVSMELPLARKEFSLVCHGVVNALPLPSLNSFLEIAERTRVVSGRADSIKFSLFAENGRSTGTVRPLYRDLKIEMLQQQTGRSDGIVQRIGSFLANSLKIRRENIPGGPDGVKEGPVQYTRKRDDPFFKFLWFSLRAGLGSVVGFSQ